MSEERKRTSVRGYIPTAALRPEVGPEFILRRRGPYRPVVGEDHREKMMAYAARMGIIASYPEAVVHHALTKRRYRDHTDFDFQSSQLGGRIDKGGAVCDFVWLIMPAIWRVQGTYWHKIFDRLGHGVSDEDQRLALEGMGYIVTDLWENDILSEGWLEQFLRRNLDVPLVHGESAWG